MPEPARPFPCCPTRISSPFTPWTATVSYTHLGFPLPEQDAGFFPRLHGTAGGDEQAAPVQPVSQRMPFRRDSAVRWLAAGCKYEMCIRDRYIGALRREGKDAWARRESDRLQGILEVLFYNPEISDAVK